MYHSNSMHIISLHLRLFDTHCCGVKVKRAYQCERYCKIVVPLSVYLCLFVCYKNNSCRTDLEFINSWSAKANATRVTQIHQSKTSVGSVWSSTLHQVMNLQDRRCCSVTETTCIEGFICSQSEPFQCPLIFHSTVLSWFQTLTHKSHLADHTLLWVSLSPFIKPGTFVGSDAGQQYWHTYLGACGQHPPFWCPKQKGMQHFLTPNLVEIFALYPLQKNVNSSPIAS